jgi:coenzyme Q-binding protein COQ10
VLSQSIKRQLPYGPETLFDLAADVERYPEFLRWWVRAVILKRGPDFYYTDQVLGLGPVRVGFRSKTVLYRPERINVTSNEAPFRELHLFWLFQPVSGGSRVKLGVRLEFNSRLLQYLVDRTMPSAVSEIISAFENRAHQLYAHADRPRSSVLSR